MNDSRNSRPAVFPLAILLFFAAYGNSFAATAKPVPAKVPAPAAGKPAALPASQTPVPAVPILSEAETEARLSAYFGKNALGPDGKVSFEKVKAVLDGYSGNPVAQNHVYRYLVGLMENKMEIASAVSEERKSRAASLEKLISESLAKPASAIANQALETPVQPKPETKSERQVASIPLSFAGILGFLLSVAMLAIGVFAGRLSRRGKDVPNASETEFEPETSEIPEEPVAEPESQGSVVEGTEGITASAYPLWAPVTNPEDSHWLEGIAESAELEEMEADIPEIPEPWTHDSRTGTVSAYSDIFQPPDTHMEKEPWESAARGIIRMNRESIARSHELIAGLENDIASSRLDFERGNVDKSDAALRDTLLNAEISKLKRSISGYERGIAEAEDSMNERKTDDYYGKPV